MAADYDWSQLAALGTAADAIQIIVWGSGVFIWSVVVNDLPNPADGELWINGHGITPIPNMIIPGTKQRLEVCGEMSSAWTVADGSIRVRVNGITKLDLSNILLNVAGSDIVPSPFAGGGKYRGDVQVNLCGRVGNFDIGDTACAAPAFVQTPVPPAVPQAPCAPKSQISGGGKGRPRPRRCC